MQGSRLRFLILFGFFLAGALALIKLPYPVTATDENAHYGYIRYLETEGRFWPDYQHFTWHQAKGDHDFFRWYDLKDGIASVPNYLNHPPFYYALMAKIHAWAGLAEREGITLLRALNLILYTIALAAFLRLGWEALPSRWLFAAYAALIILGPKLFLYAGMISNDSLGLLGGALTSLGAYRLLAAPGRSPLVLLLAGFLMAALAKLTAGIACGIILALTLADLLRKNEALVQSWRWRLLCLAVIGAGAAPYLYLWLHEGSPAPTSIPGQIAMVKGIILRELTSHEGPLSFPAFTLLSVHRLILLFALFHAASFIDLHSLWAAMIPVLGGYYLFAFFAASLLYALWKREERLTAYGAASYLILFLLNLTFAWLRHRETGWILDMFPRYYFPLIGIGTLCMLQFAQRLGVAPRIIMIGTLLLTCSFYIAGSDFPTGRL